MKIVFVCTGNASRSAVAEVILRKMIQEKNLEDIEVSSCGTDVPYGQEREGIMCQIAAEHGYSMGGKAVMITAELVNAADRIIVMTTYTATQSFLVSIVKREGMEVHAELFFATYAIALVCMRVGFRNYFDRVPYRRFLAICTGSALVSMLLLDFAGHNLCLVGAAVCMAGGFGIMCSESQAAAMMMVDNAKRGLANSTYLIGLDSGMALGPMVGDLLYSHAPAGCFYPWLMVTAVLGGLVYWAGRKRLSKI